MQHYNEKEKSGVDCNEKLPVPNVIHPIAGYDKEASSRWGITEHWVQKFGRSWMIPKDTVRPDKSPQEQGKRRVPMVNKRKRKIFIWVTSIAVVLAVIVGVCAVYVNDYYRADAVAIAAFAPQNTVTKEVLGDNTIVYAPEDAAAGFIFYPGGKVEYTAYAPLMQACADRGILCVLVEMPFNLAVLDRNAADGIQEKYPEIEDWYIGGHSLGGSMAASYLADHTNDYEGLILLGSYSTADLSDTELSALSVYGSEDKVLNREKYNGNKSNLPDHFEELVIDGGCHAYFGVYGAQDGDGIPTITNKEQINLTVDAIVRFVSDNKSEDAA